MLLFPIIYTVTVVVVKGVPSTPLTIPYFGTIFQENKFEDKEPRLFDWKLLGKAVSYYNAVTSPDVWYFKTVSSYIHNLNKIVVEVHDKDDELMTTNKGFDNKSIAPSLVFAETVTSHEKEFYRDNTERNQSPSYFSLSTWVYTDLMISLGYDVANISLANVVGKHYQYYRDYYTNINHTSSLVSIHLLIYSSWSLDK